MMMQFRDLAKFSLVAASFVSGAANATTLKRMSVADLSHTAHSIVRARCVTNSTRWDAGEIWTFTAFEVEEIWKGSPPSRVTVRLLGGDAGDLTSTVSGVPRFAPGEQVVLFLERTAGGDFSVVSWVQGTFRIGNDRVTGEETITQDTAAFAILDPASHRFQASGIRRMPAAAFRALVTASLNSERGARK
ncbi:MAG: hypothetical protein WB987_02420 [Candidatus Acidiferrales bacterium]